MHPTVHEVGDGAFEKIAFITSEGALKERLANRLNVRIDPKVLSVHGDVRVIASWSGRFGFLK